VKKYYFIVANFSSVLGNGEMNLGFVADEQNPLKNSKIKEAIRKQVPFRTDVDVNIVVTQIYQFENENEYQNFWL
jgi:hypothetical protein